MEGSKSKDLEEDEELKALRLAALATLKGPPNSSERESASPIPTYAKTSSPALTSAANAGQVTRKAENDQISFITSSINNYSWRKNNLSRRRGPPHPRTANLIVINPVDKDNDNKQEEKKGRGSKSEKFKVLDILPQFKWCGSGTEDSMSPKTLRKTGPTRFNRHGSDSESSESDYSEDSESDSGSNETVLQDEPPQRFKSVSPSRDAQSSSKSPEKARRLSFQNFESDVNPEKSEPISVYKSLRKTSTSYSRSDSYTSAQSKESKTWDCDPQNSHSSLNEYSSQSYSDRQNSYRGYSSQSSSVEPYRDGGNVPVWSQNHDLNNSYFTGKNTPEYNPREPSNQTLYLRDANHSASGSHMSDKHLPQNDLRLELRKRGSQSVRNQSGNDVRHSTQQNDYSYSYRKRSRSSSRDRYPSSRTRGHSSSQERERFNASKDTDMRKDSYNSSRGRYSGNFQSRHGNDSNGESHIRHSRLDKDDRIQSVAFHNRTRPHDNNSGQNESKQDPKSKLQNAGSEKQSSESDRSRHEPKNLSKERRKEGNSPSHQEQRTYDLQKSSHKKLSPSRDKRRNEDQRSGRNRSKSFSRSSSRGRSHSSSSNKKRRSRSRSPTQKRRISSNADTKRSRSLSSSPDRKRHRGHSSSLDRKRYRSRSSSLDRKRHSRSSSRGRKITRSRSSSCDRGRTRSRSSSFGKKRRRSHSSSLDKLRSRSLSSSLSKKRSRSFSSSLDRKNSRSRSSSFIKNSHSSSLDRKKHRSLSSSLERKRSRSLKRGSSKSRSPSFDEKKNPTLSSNQDGKRYSSKSPVGRETILGSSSERKTSVSVDLTKQKQNSFQTTQDKSSKERDTAEDKILHRRSSVSENQILIKDEEKGQDQSSGRQWYKRHSVDRSSSEHSSSEDSDRYGSRSRRKYRKSSSDKVGSAQLHKLEQITKKSLSKNEVPSKHEGYVKELSKSLENQSQERRKDRIWSECPQQFLKPDKTQQVKAESANIHCKQEQVSRSKAAIANEPIFSSPEKGKSQIASSIVEIDKTTNQKSPNQGNRSGVAYKNNKDAKAEEKSQTSKDRFSAPSSSESKPSSARAGRERIKRRRRSSKKSRRDNYTRSRSRSRSSSYSSSSSDGARPKIRSVTSVVKPISIITAKPERKRITGPKSTVLSQSDNYSLSKGSDSDRSKSFQSVQLDSDKKAAETKRVPVHMRLGTLPGHRLLKPTKAVEAAFVNSSSGSDNEGVSTKLRQQSISITANISGGKSEVVCSKTISFGGRKADNSTDTGLRDKPGRLKTYR